MKRNSPASVHLKRSSFSSLVELQSNREEKNETILDDGMDRRGSTWCMFKCLKLSSGVSRTTVSRE